MKYTELHNIAARKVRSRRRFYKHFAFFVSAMVFLFGINIITYDWRDGLWALIPFLGWGSLVLFQYLLVFGFPFSGALSEDWERRELKKEMNKLDKIPMDKDEYEDLSIEERLELRELERLKDKWESDQFV